MALEAIKKWMKEHDPHKPVKPEALGKGTRKVTPPKKKTKKTPTKVTPKGTPKKAVKANAPKNVPIPADKPKSGKTAQVAAKKVVKQEADKPKSKGLVRDPKTGKLPSANIVPKGKQYKSAGIVKSLGILPKKEKKTSDVASKTTDKVKPSKTPKFDAAMAKKKPKTKKAGLLNQLFGG